MSTKSQTDAESNVDQPAAVPADVELRRPFLIEASGTATKKTRVSEGLVETEETEISISRQAGTLEAFDAVYVQSEARDWKANVVQKLLSEEAPENVAYEFHADYSSKLVNYHQSLTESETLDEDEAFAMLVDDCRESPLFGPGAAIAELDAKNAAREDLEFGAERLLEDVRENRGE